ncbi:MFS transporter [Streptomyces sp. TRM72054]|uniref:MFS transporter n=1 Tax=Streptomyces sp. TRM72054 TaxID=2870562 RepID=UPI0021AB7C2C|nr:MFS transporter [Streptomyces sp. TRM72054]
MPSASGTPGKLPFVVWVLAAGTFLMGTTEFVVAGLLPELAGDLGVSVSHAGLLITAFAIGMIVGAPTMAMATLRLPQRLTLILALSVFCLGHLVAALSTSFTIVLAARVVTALATGAFWSVGFVVATTAAGPHNATRATGVMIGGLTLANVVGVPIGSFAGHTRRTGRPGRGRVDRTPGHTGRDRGRHALALRGMPPPSPPAKPWSSTAAKPSDGVAARRRAAAVHPGTPDISRASHLLT